MLRLPSHEEEDFLTQRRELTRASARHSLRRCERAAGQFLGVQRAADEHPVLLAGGVAAAGALVGYFIEIGPAARGASRMLARTLVLP